MLAGSLSFAVLPACSRWMNQSAGNFTFGHELAHNQGGRHDRLHDPSDGGAFLYSHGYIEPQGLFRTVMGVSTPGIPRIQYFSNSDVSYEGEPTGLPVGDPDSAHNALTIENTAYNVANFRRSNDCNGNGICDDVEVATGIAQDCNGNGVRASHLEPRTGERIS